MTEALLRLYLAGLILYFGLNGYSGGRQCVALYRLKNYNFKEQLSTLWVEHPI